MGVEAVPIPAREQRRDSLTRRASFTAGASLLDYAARIVVALLVTPILVNGLGRSLYGVWEMLHRLVNYMTATDGRPTEALRLIVANQQQTADAAQHRRHVGSALVVWLLFLPLVLLAGAVLTWLAPAITRVPPELHGTVRMATLLLVISLLVAGLAAVPESALRGMNLGYRRMGLQAGLNVVSGLLMAGAVIAGLGLWGLAAAQIAAYLAAGLLFWLLARKYVRWFGVERPGRTEVRRMLGMSGWLALGDVVARLVLASDVIIVGMLISSSMVATYVLTGYAAKTATGVLTFGMLATMPGLGGVLGEGRTERAASVRREMLTLTWLFVTVTGGAILLWNHSFVSLWVGPANYAGPWIDLLIVLIAVQTAFIRTDAYIIDAALHPRRRVLFGLAAAAMTIGLGVVLSYAFGLLGMCLAVLAGRGIQTVAYPLVVRTLLRDAYAVRVGAPVSRWAGRPVLVTTFLFALTLLLGQQIEPPNWVAWCAAVALSVALLAPLAFTLGLSASQRVLILERWNDLRSWIGARNR